MLFKFHETGSLVVIGFDLEILESSYFNEYYNDYGTFELDDPTHKYSYKTQGVLAKCVLHTLLN